MPRSNWKGIISFGLVAIPIILYPSRNKEADISFHQIDRRNNARIKYKRINTVTGKEVPWDEITRGYEYDKEITIPVPDDVLKKVAGENARTINIESFIEQKEFNFFTINNTYFLTPDEKGKGEKGYVILREALKESHKIGIAKVIISTKEYIAAVMPYKDALLLCTLSYDTEMREFSEFDLPNKKLDHYKISKKEMTIAHQLIDSMTAKWKPEDYVDEYQAAIHKWVEEEVNNKTHSVSTKKKTQAPSNVVDFVDLLKKSLSSSQSKKSKTSTRKANKPIHFKHKAKSHRASQGTRH